MTYATGKLIDDADYGGMLTTVTNVYGMGIADRGYGQTAISQPSIAAGAPIRGTNWTNLTHMIIACANHQATPVSNLPPDSAFVAGMPIKAMIGITSDFMTDRDTTDKPLGVSAATGSFSIPNYVTAIDNNRFATAPTALSITANTWSINRKTTWSNTIAAEVSVGWGNEDDARHFFNSGGQIRMHGSHPVGNAQDNRWNSVLTNMGLVAFALHSTTCTGLPGAQNVGYYELTDAYRAIYNMRPPGSYAVSTSTLIEAKRLNFIGARGGNGSGVQFRVTLKELGFYYMTVTAAGSTFGFDTVRATTFLAGIVAPAYATVDPF